MRAGRLVVLLRASSQPAQARILELVSRLRDHRPSILASNQPEVECRPVLHGVYLADRAHESIENAKDRVHDGARLRIVHATQIGSDRIRTCHRLDDAAFPPDRPPAVYPRSMADQIVLAWTVDVTNTSFGPAQAATALAADAELWTVNTDNFEHIEELRLVNPLAL